MEVTALKFLASICLKVIQSSSHRERTSQKRILYGTYGTTTATGGLSKHTKKQQSNRDDSSFEVSFRCSRFYIILVKITTGKHWTARKFADASAKNSAAWYKRSL